MDYVKLLRKILISGRGVSSKKEELIMSGKYPNIYNFIFSIYPDSTSIRETFKRLELGLHEKPKCPICGKPVEFIGKKNLMFRKYCSCSCRGKDPVNYMKWVEGQYKYNLEHYGVRHNFQVDTVKQKSRDTMKEKYGVEYFNNIEKRKATNLKQHGTEYYNNYEQRNATMIERYGSQTYNNQEKRNFTLKKKPYKLSSIAEDNVYNILKENFPDIIRQYTSKEYPFLCDFYIPSIDLYIEYNGSQFHGGHPFNENNKEDIDRLDKLTKKAKDSPRHLQGKESQYDTMIYVWTDLDVRKRNTAKQNNLNFLEFFDIDEAKEFIRQYNKETSMG